MRSLKAIMNDENKAWKELCDIDDDILSYERHIADIRAIPVDCPSKDRDIEKHSLKLGECLCKREAAVEILNLRRNELREYFTELMKGE